MDSKKHKAARRLFEPIGKPAPPLALVACARCGETCQVRPQEPPQLTPSVVLRAATTDRGMCRECAAHWWLYSIDGIRWAIEETGGKPGALSYPATQAALNNVLALMHPELAGCDWSKMQAQWDVPWPADWVLPIDTLNG